MVRSRGSSGGTTAVVTLVVAPPASRLTARSSRSTLLVAAQSRRAVDGAAARSAAVPAPASAAAPERLFGRGNRCPRRSPLAWRGVCVRASPAPPPLLSSFFFFGSRGFLLPRSCCQPAAARRDAPHFQPTPHLLLVRAATMAGVMFTDTFVLTEVDMVPDGKDSSRRVKDKKFDKGALARGGYPTHRGGGGGVEPGGLGCCGLGRLRSGPCPPLHAAQW